MSPNLENLVDAVYYVLEPHATYISKGGDEDIRYFVPPEILEALTWIGLHVCIPIITGVTTSVVADRLTKKEPSEVKRALELQKG
jgi:hypothetical protein